MRTQAIDRPYFYSKQDRIQILFSRGILIRRGTDNKFYVFDKATRKPISSGYVNHGSALRKAELIDDERYYDTDKEQQ